MRHTFQTIADGSRDAVAVATVMGHVDASMAGHYRERIDDERLRAVADHVRAWLFGKDTMGGQEGADQADDQGAGDPGQEDDRDERPTLKLFAG